MYSNERDCIPKLEYAGDAWEGNAKLVEKLETVQIAVATAEVRGRQVRKTAGNSTDDSS